jgi:hypothetical protein
MGSKFISTSNGDLQSVSDGSLDILGASVGAQNLTPGFPVKIDSERKLYSTTLVIADVVNLQSELDATIQTPYNGTIEATDYKTSSVPSFNTAITTLNTTTQNINTSGVITNITGKLQNNGVPVLQETTTRNIITTGKITCDDLETTTYPSLNTELTDLNNTTAINKINITALEQKTSWISTPFGARVTVFDGSIAVFGAGDDPTDPSIDPLGGIVTGTLACNDSLTVNGQLVVQDGTFANGSISAPKINGVVHIRSTSELPTTLAANTSYIIHGTITTTSTLTISADGCSISGHDRTKDKLIYTGTGTFITVMNVNFSLENVGITASTGKAMSAANYTSGNYNRGRDKVLSMVSCEFRNCQDVWDIVGFDLCDILNCLVWYCTGTTGCTFQDTSKLQITSSEFIRWFSESSIPTPSSYSTAAMIELKADGADNAGFGAVSISSCIMHPQQTQKGISVSSSSTAGFATISANTFINIGLTTGIMLDLDINAQPAYVLEANQGVVNGTAIGELKLTGNTAVTAVASQGTPVQVNGTTSFTIPSQTRRFTGVNTGTLTYNAKNSTEMFVSCTVSGQMDDNKDKEVSFYIAKNGTIDPDLVGAVEFKTDVLRTVSFSGTVFAEQNDVFTVWAENNQDSEDIIVNSLKMTMFSL